MTSRPAEASQGRPRVLVLRALGLGDLLTGLPALRAVADAFPGHHRVLAAPAAFTPLLGAAVDELLDTDYRRGFRPLRWRGEPPELAVNLQGPGPQSTEVLASTRPRRLLRFGRAGGPVWRSDEHEVARWCRLLREEGIPADPSRLAIDVVPDHSMRGVTVVHPGAASASRRWPVDRWAAVARALARDGARVVVTGDHDEVGLARAVADGAGLSPDTVLAGRTDVAGLAAQIAAAARVLCGDTGVAHLATATGTPSVVLFGPTDPALWGPPALPIHRVLWAGQTGDPHADHPHPGLLTITVDDVLFATRSLPDL